MNESLLATLPEEVTNYISSLEAKITRYESQLHRLEEMLRSANHSIYGRSSEKTRYVLNNPNQMSLFNEAEVCADSLAPEETITPKPYNRKKKRTKEELARELPVKEEIIDLPQTARECDICKSELRPIGKELVRREVCVIPAQVYVKEVYTVNYSCNACLEETDEAHIIKPEVPVPVINHGLASPSSAAYTIYQKYVNALPLDRQEKDWAYFGVQISRTTLANWVIYCAMHWLKPIFNLMHTLLVVYKVIQADESVIQVLHELGKTPQSESRMWVYCTGDHNEPQIILFEYQPNRAGQNPKEFLQNASDFYLLTDGYAGYNAVAGATHSGCWSHMQRKLIEALPATAKNESKAAEGLTFSRKLFELEDKFKDLSPDERYEERLKYSKPVVDAFFAWVHTVNPLSGSKLGTAIIYATNQQKALSTFLLDGRIAIHNNLCENSLRPFVKGRVNWLFSNSMRGAESSAICYSIIETAKKNGINPYKYLNYIFEELPTVLTKSPDADLTRFLPWSEEVKARCQIKDSQTGRLLL